MGLEVRNAVTAAGICGALAPDSAGMGVVRSSLAGQSVLRIDQRPAVLPAQAEVQGQPRVDLEVVLHKVSEKRGLDVLKRNALG